MRWINFATILLLFRSAPESDRLVLASRSETFVPSWAPFTSTYAFSHTFSTVECAYRRRPLARGLQRRHTGRGNTRRGRPRWRDRRKERGDRKGRHGRRRC